MAWLRPRRCCALTRQPCIGGSRLPHQRQERSPSRVRDKPCVCFLQYQRMLTASVILIYYTQRLACSSTPTTSPCPTRVRGRRSTAARAQLATVTVLAVRTLSSLLHPLSDVMRPFFVFGACMADCSSLSAILTVQPLRSSSSTRRSRRSCTLPSRRRPRARTRSCRAARCTTTLCAWTCGLGGLGGRRGSDQDEIYKRGG